MVEVAIGQQGVAIHHNNREREDKCQAAKRHANWLHPPQKTKTNSIIHAQIQQKTVITVRLLEQNKIIFPRQPPHRTQKPTTINRCAYEASHHCCHLGALPQIFKRLQKQQF